MNFHWESLVFAIIAFAILYWLLNRYAFGPLFSIMEKRREHVQDQIRTAESNRQKSEQLMAEQKEAIEKARKDAFDIIEQARLTSARQAEEIALQASEQANRIKQEALKEIENEKNKAIIALRSQVSGMSILIASKIIEKQVDEKSQQELIEKFLQQVGGI